MPTSRSGRSSPPSSPAATSGLAARLSTHASGSGHGRAVQVDRRLEVGGGGGADRGEVDADGSESGCAHGERGREQRVLVLLLSEPREPEGDVDVGGGQHSCLVERAQRPGGALDVAGRRMGRASRTRSPRRASSVEQVAQRLDRAASAAARRRPRTAARRREACPGRSCREGTGRGRRRGAGRRRSRGAARAGSGAARRGRAALAAGSARAASRLRVRRAGSARR